MGSETAHPKLLRIGECVLDLSSGELERAGERTRLPEQPFRVLELLTAHPHEVVSRELLKARLWPKNSFVDFDTGLNAAVRKLRAALDDDAEAPRYIETLPRRGYRCVADVEVMAPPEPVPLPTEQQTSGLEPEPTTRPSIAVLPFRNMSGDPEQEYFSDGITEDITTDLSRIPGLFVIARNSSFSFKGKQATIQQISRELGARYILQGSVRKSGSGVRVTAQLADARDGGCLWAERYDRQLRDIFAVQDDLTRQIVSVLAVTLAPAKKTQAVRRATCNMEAYEYILRGRESGSIRAVRPRTPSWLALSHAIEYVNEWSEQPDQSLRLADELANKAVRLDDTDAQAHFVLGECCLWARREHDAAMHEGTRAVDLDPNYSHAYLLLGHTLHYAGRSEESLEPYKTACYPDLYLHFLAQSYYSLGRYGGAIEMLEERVARNPGTDISHVLLAACYGRLGMREEAHSSWKTALAINPDYSLETKRKVLPYKNPGDFDDFVEGLRRARVVR